MADYITVAQSAQAVYEEKRSRFIAQICEVRDETAAKKNVATVKKKYFDARHNPYAYILAEDKERNSAMVKSNDDGEPGGTAGMPILNVLKNRGLKNVLVVVTRYFGGIKLGASGLLRAYSQAATLAVNAAVLVEVKTFSRINVTVDYSLYSALEQFVRRQNVRAENPIYADTVTLPLLAENSAAAEKIIAAATDITGGSAIIESAGFVTVRELKEKS